MTTIKRIATYVLLLPLLSVSSYGQIREIGNSIKNNGIGNSINNNGIGNSIKNNGIGNSINNNGIGGKIQPLQGGRQAQQANQPAAQPAPRQQEQPEKQPQALGVGRDDILGADVGGDVTTRDASSEFTPIVIRGSAGVSVNEPGVVMEGNESGIDKGSRHSQIIGAVLGANMPGVDGSVDIDKGFILEFRMTDDADGLLTAYLTQMSLSFSGRVFLAGVLHSGLNTDSRKPWVKVDRKNMTVSEEYGPVPSPFPAGEEWFEKANTYGDIHVSGM